jgi:predicted GH43/DUF377 family glycosyl hydrolase
MKCRKLGLVYAPSGEKWWARSYALLPTVHVLDENTLRIYFASLDEGRFGRIGFVEVDARDPRRIGYETPEPVLDVGELGTFDDSGVNPSCIVTVGEQQHLYYIGWQRCERVPYKLFAGLAISKDGGSTFNRYQPVPLLERTPVEPFLRSATTIVREKDLWRMWYVSALRWTYVNNVQYPSYVIRYAESIDGMAWTASPEICINFADPDEFGFGRPWVIKEDDRYKMWYSIRSHREPYRIGYAESRDGVHWERLDDQVGIARSESGWDSEMICYPCVVDVPGKRYLFYNGNRHGSTGFGCAVLEG